VPGGELEDLMMVPGCDGVLSEGRGGDRSCLTETSRSNKAGEPVVINRFRKTGI
jgi:hypothetical protein